MTLTITPYATHADLVAFVGSGYTVPGDVDAGRMLQRASELIYDATGNLSERAYNGQLTAGYFGYVDPLTVPAALTVDDYKFALKNAACAQVEFWLETGEEHDVLGLRGSATAGKISLSRIPTRLAPRALGYLRAAGLTGSKVGIR